MEEVFNIPTLGPVQDLLNRAGGRVELLVHFSAKQGYELVDWNRAASELFDRDGRRPDPSHLADQVKEPKNPRRIDRYQGLS